MIKVENVSQERISEIYVIVTEYSLFNEIYMDVIKLRTMEQLALKNVNKLFEYHHFLLLRDIWWSKF